MVETSIPSPTSPVFQRTRRSLPDCQGDHSNSAAPSPDIRRSFRSTGRSPNSSSFSSGRSSLRLKRGSPSPARKLTSPQGPNLATASRQRQCKCSEVHHHGPHGHITPVEKRVPLERERAGRRSRRSIPTTDSKTTSRTPRSSITPSVASSARSFPSRESPARSVSKETATPRQETPEPSVSQDQMGECQEKYQSAARKGSVTTLVNWVPWLAEKRFSTTLRITPHSPTAAPVTTVLSPRKGSGEIQHFKIIHTSSSVAPPSFATALGAPPSAEFMRLTIA